MLNLRRFSWTKALCGCAFAGGLAACDVTPIRTIWELRKVDPAITAPEALRIAVRVPDGLRPQTSEMRLIGTLNATETRQRQSKSFAIVPDATPLPDWLNTSHSRIYGFRIPDEDIPELRAFQALAREAKKENGGGSFSIFAKVCTLEPSFPNTIPISAYLKTEELTDFVPLFVDQDVLEEIDAADLRKAVPQC